MHNTLASSDYGLLDDNTLMPRPNYWAALLWHNLMGTTVLDPGLSTTSSLHLYSHCLRGQPGGVALLAINTDRSASQSLDLAQAAAERYTLTAPSLEATSIQLERERNETGTGGRNAEVDRHSHWFRPCHVAAGRDHVPRYSKREKCWLPLTQSLIVAALRGNGELRSWQPRLQPGRSEEHRWCGPLLQLRRRPGAGLLIIETCPCVRRTSSLRMAQETSILDPVLFVTDPGHRWSQGSQVSPSRAGRDRPPRALPA